MKKLFESALTRLLLLVLVALGVFQIWQLDRIEGRLVALERRGAGAPSDAGAPPLRAADCKASAWWASDATATAEPGNLLRMHDRCKVRAEHVVRGGTFRRIWASDPNGLWSYGAGGSTADVREISAYVSDALAYRHPDAQEVWSPALAQSVTQSADGKVLTVRLRSGVLWQQPSLDLKDPRHSWLVGEHELTADDYMFVFQRALDPAAPGRFATIRGGLGDLVSVNKVDRYTFSLTFSEHRYATLGAVLELDPVPSWLYGFGEDGQALPEAGLSEALGKPWYSGAIGVGPYVLEEWRAGESVTLRRNLTYWGESPAFDRVRLSIIKDKAGWPRALENEELDFVYLQPAQYRTTVLDAKGGPIFGNPRIKVAISPPSAYFYVGWNRMNPRLQDRRVRQALSMAVDRQGLLDNVFAGLGEIVSGPLSPSQSCYDASVTPWPYDPAAAAALLTEAGWVDGDGDGVRERLVGGERLELRLELLLQNTPEWDTMGNQLAEAFRKVGVGLTPVALDWPTLQPRGKARDFEAYAGSWSLGADDWSPRDLWHSSTADQPGSANYVTFRDPALDTMIESFELDFDVAHRLDTCRGIHRALREDEPYMFLFTRRSPVLWWDHLNDVELFSTTPSRDLRYYSFNQVRP